jgi:thioredoxin 1
MRNLIASLGCLAAWITFVGCDGQGGFPNLGGNNTVLPADVQTDASIEDEAIAQAESQRPATSGSSTVRDVSARELHQILADESRLVIVDFHAHWCGPCKMLAPLLKNIAKKYSQDVRIVKVDIDRNRELAQKLNIQSIPFVVFFRDGDIVGSFVGLKSQQEIESLVRRY